MTANHEHTPTVDELRRMYALKVPHDQRDRRNAEFDRFLSAAEQRGAVKELKQLLQELMEGEFQVGHHAGLHTASTIISARLIELLVNADQMEGDDE